MLELSAFAIPYVHAYMDDVFCMPVMLTIALFLMRKFVFNNENHVFTKGHILAAIIYCSVVFELILPMLSEKYTADLFDVLAYAIGGIIFHKFINQAQLIPSTSLATRNISNASSLV